MEIHDTYTALVTHAQDPLKRGRVRLLAPQLSGTAVQQWADPAFPAARTPKIGEQVWLFFDGADIDRPVYIASPVASDSGSYPHMQPKVTKQKLTPNFNTVTTDIPFTADEWESITFTVPDSGMVFITISANLSNRNSTGSSVWATWQLSGGHSGAGGADRDYRGVSSAGLDTRLHASRRTLVTGLVPGAVLTVTPQYYVSSATPEVITFEQGQLVVEPVPTQPYPPSSTQQNQTPPFTTTATFVDFTTAQWPALTVVVPPSGMVFVTISGFVQNTNTSTSTSWLGYRLSGARTEALVVPYRNKVSISGSGGSGRVAGSRRTLFTGLTPGAQLTITPAWMISSGSAATATAQGGQLIAEPVADAAYLPAMSEQLDDVASLVPDQITPFTSEEWEPVTVTVPPTGSVHVSISAILRNEATASSTIFLGWYMSGGYSLAGLIDFQALAGEGLGHRAYASRRVTVTDLPVGAEVTITPVWYVSDVAPGLIILSAGQLVAEPVPPGDQDIHATLSVPFIPVATSAIRDLLPKRDGMGVVRLDTKAIEVYVNGVWKVVSAT